MAQPRDDKTVELADYLAVVTGDGAVNCGVQPMSRVGGQLVVASQAEMSRSRDCALRASASATPFWTYAQYPGDESWHAYGLAGGRDGRIYAIDYAGAPGGVSSDPGRFSISLCQPPIHITSPPWRRYRCGGIVN